MLALFDAADPNGVTAVRNDTTVPSQSLFLLNSPFVREQARHFAERLLADDEATDDERIAAGAPPRPSAARRLAGETGRRAATSSRPT